LQTSPETSSLFNYYNFYKVIIGILLLGVSFSQAELLNSFRFAETFQILTLSYLFLNITTLVFFRFILSGSARQVFAVITLDIFALHALFYTGIGISGGLINLLVITVAAGNIIIRGRIGLSFAASASLLSMGIETERLLTGIDNISDLARSGLMGCVYFATAYMLQFFATRITQSESLAKQREQDIIELEKLNHHIIQSMRTGIIVCDDHFKIILINQSCKDLINIDANDHLPSFIIDRIQLWQQDPSERTTPFKASAEKPLVQANFSHLQKNKTTDILIFIDDTRLMTQQAQQLKLASLGRLTASIAHEVRNPLGAISHASQLLAESDNLDFADKKMTDIIQRHSKRVNLIIENTLQLSRRSEPEAVEIQLKEWLTSIISEYINQREGLVKINLEIDSPLETARFDPGQIEQVLINLIDNGVRHGTQENPNAVLKVTLGVLSAGKQAYIDIIDQGAGISEENTQHLFEPFFTTESQGTGLGLYLSREMCEASQAQLDYINTDEPGACFRLMFAHRKRII
jgi:two-component system sensor histidine kinase PilS (NtrC family)